VNDDKKKSTITPEILIVDDLPANLKVLGSILESEGYIVRPVRNGKLALDVAEKVMPHLILLDILMPGMDGFEVCRRLKENQKLHEIPVIFISAIDDVENIVKALNSGGIDYITRPFRAEEVKARVSIHIKGYQQRNLIEEQSKELQKLNADKDKFFSIIAHDLRSPLIGFLGLTSLLVEEARCLTQAEILDIANDIRNSSTDIFRLLENLLEWSRMEQGLVPFKPGKMQLRPVVDESLPMALETARNKEIEISIDIPDFIYVFADNNLLQSIFRNLAYNAIKFTPREGKVKISARTDNKNIVKISIKDTGIGMSSEMVESLFKLNVQTNRAGTEGEPTVGLGLILCKEFIEKLGGTLCIETEEGKGSVFSFSLAMESSTSALKDMDAKIITFPTNSPPSPSLLRKEGV
jgi:two-component system sensor histidine kinase/response regulator